MTVIIKNYLFKVYCIPLSQKTLNTNYKTAT